MDQNFLLAAVFLCLAILIWFESFGFFFRVAGAKLDNLVVGYTLQNSLQFFSRFWALIFNSCFAYLADTRSINPGKYFLFFYYAVAIVFMINIYIFNKEYINAIEKIIKKIEKKNNLIIVFIKYIPSSVFFSFRKMIFLPNFFYNIPKEFIEFLSTKSIPRSLKIRLILFSITYIGYFSCWPAIATLISIYPDKPAFLISLSTFFTLFSTVYQTIFLDPMISFYKDPKTLSFIYKKIHFLKIMILIMLMFLQLLINV